MRKITLESFKQDSEAWRVDPPVKAEGISMTFEINGNTSFYDKATDNLVDALEGATMKVAKEINPEALRFLSGEPPKPKKLTQSDLNQKSAFANGWERRIYGYGTHEYTKGDFKIVIGEWGDCNIYNEKENKRLSVDWYMYDLTPFLESV